MNSWLRAILVCISTILPFANSAYAANIVQITIDEMGIPFVLDDKGHVWGFREPRGLQHPIKLPNLEHIKRIAPYIALDDEGRVFTWGIDDNKVNADQGEIIEAGYTEPQRFGDLKGVTMIAHSMNHFFAVVDNQEILEWIVIRKGNEPGGGFGIEGYGPVRSLISRSGIVGIAAAPGTMERVVSEPAPFGLVALFADGEVIGWGINSSGQILREANSNSVLLTKLPGAIGIAMNAFHVVVLTASGVPRFWGGCDIYGRDGQDSGRLWTYGSVHGTDGFVSDVIAVALAQDINTGGAGGWGNDNNVPDVFLKRDGTVWIANAPLPTGAPNIACGQYNSQIDYQQEVQIAAGKTKATQVITSTGRIIMLDADHQLWMAPSNHRVKDFRRLMLSFE